MQCQWKSKQPEGVLLYASFVVGSARTLCIRKLFELLIKLSGIAFCVETTASLLWEIPKNSKFSLKSLFKRNKRRKTNPSQSISIAQVNFPLFLCVTA